MSTTPHRKFLTEIRFIPNPLVLDIRGKLASLIVSDEFRNWNVSKDRVEVFSDYAMIFISHANMGFVTFRQDKIDACLDRLDQAIRELGDLPPNRWGVRIFSYEPSTKSFDILRKRYEDTLLNFQPKNFSRVGGKLVDVGVSYVFQKDKDKYHLTSGPMEKEQALQYFPNEKLPAKGVFIDLDIYREKDNFYKDDFRRSRIKDYISGRLKEGIEIVEEINQLIENG